MGRIVFWRWARTFSASAIAGSNAERLRQEPNTDVRVTLIETEGRGRTAEVEVDGHRLRVVDRLSPADRPERPGPVEDARLEVVVIPHLTRRVAASAQARAALEPEHGWRYRAHGEVVSARPLVADLGLLRLELEVADPDAWAVGDRVSVAIDRIVLTRAGG